MNEVEHTHMTVTTKSPSALGVIWFFVKILLWFGFAWCIAMAGLLSLMIYTGKGFGG